MRRPILEDNAWQSCLGPGVRALSTNCSQSPVNIVTFSIMHEVRTMLECKGKYTQYGFCRVKHGTRGDERRFYASTLPSRRWKIYELKFVFSWGRRSTTCLSGIPGSLAFQYRLRIYPTVNLYFPSIDGYTVNARVFSK